MRFSIGEFSRITSLTIKSLRLYHEKGILVPAAIDESSGYRYYNEANCGTAHTIKILKEYDFTLAEIKEILDECNDESDLLEHFQQKLHSIHGKIDQYKEIFHSIESIIQMGKENAMKSNQAFEVEEKELDTVLIAGRRMKGKYEEIGKGLGFLYKKISRNASGKPMTLYYDGEYKEEDADFEPCLPIRRGKDVDGISVRELKGGRAVTLIHKGPYKNLSSSYKEIFAYINEKGYRTKLPFREVYLKGPGMIFKGNPKNYLTEIQILIEG